MGNNCGCNFEGEGGELAFDKDVVSYGSYNSRKKQSFASRLQSTGELSIDRRRKSTNPGSVVRLEFTLTLLKLECAAGSQSSQI
jgi:hypothetical protein